MDNVEPRLTRDLSRVDFSDRHEGPVTDASLEELVQRLIRYRPRWVGIAMKIRDFLVRPFGLSTSDESLDTMQLERLEEGSRSGPFWFIAVGQDEIIAGNDDRHLDFRVHLTKEKGLVVRTDVFFKNVFGRLYFALIRIGHVWVVRSMLSHTADAQR